MIKLKYLCLGLLFSTQISIYNATAQVTNPSHEYKPSVYLADELSSGVKLVLILSKYKLYVYKDDSIIRTYSVAIGKKRWETPVGNWTITDKIVNPGWTNFITGKIISSNKSPLVSRWIEFYKVPGSKDVIGFHGTRDIKSIGKSSSHGCVRMHPKDVEDLYNLVNIGTKVEVKS